MLRLDAAIFYALSLGLAQYGAIIVGNNGMDNGKIQNRT